MFVLDGQQRIQTLYSIFYGSMDAPDGKTSLEAYLDITSGDEPDEDGLYYKLEFKENNPGLPYFRINDLLTVEKQKNAEELADQINESLDQDSRYVDESGDEKKDRPKRVRRNIAQLTSLLREQKHFWVQTLDGVADKYPYRTVRDIFVRVNSGGTKLDAADLMFAVMKEAWEPIEELVEQTVGMLNESKLHFDKNFVLKCIVTAISGDARVDVDKFADEGEGSLLKSIESSWPDIEKAFQGLRDFLVNDLKIYGDRVIRSYGSFIPIFDFMFHNPNKEPISIQRMRAYFYKSQLFNWYRAQTDNVINGIHKFVGKKVETGFPLSEICKYFSERKSITTLTRDHLLETRLRYILLNLIYVEKFGNSPFDVRYAGNEPQIDHIYPKSKLYSVFQIGIQEVNHLGNYRFVGANDNLRKRAELPSSYFGRLKESQIDIYKHLLLPTYADDPSSLEFNLETYREFRDKRLDEIEKITFSVVNVE